MLAIPEHLRSVFTTRRYTNPRLRYITLLPCVYIRQSSTCVWCKPASSLELPYTIKRNGDSTSSKDGSKAKKPLSPPPTVGAAAASSTAVSGQRKKPASASKNKSSGWLACHCRCQSLLSPM